MAKEKVMGVTGNQVNGFQGVDDEEEVGSNEVERETIVSHLAINLHPPALTTHQSKSTSSKSSNASLLSLCR